MKQMKHNEGSASKKESNTLDFVDHVEVETFTTYQRTLLKTIDPYSSSNLTEAEKKLILKSFLINKNLFKVNKTDAPPPKAKVIIERAPGSNAVGFFSLILTKNAYKRLIEPLVGDFREEYFEAELAGDNTKKITLKFIYYGLMIINTFWAPVLSVLKFWKSIAR